MKKKPDPDKPERYVPRVQRYPNRLHRGGAGGGDMDFTADEFLYSPSILGYAEVEPKEVVAKTEQRLKLTFHVGSAGIPEGACVYFSMRGQKPLGCNFQCEDPKRSHFFRVQSPDRCELEVLGAFGGNIALGFKVRKGCLKENDDVIIFTEPPKGFRWTPLAGRREFKVVVKYNDGTPERRLPEPLVVKVLPCSLNSIEVTIPCTRRKDSILRVNVTARDKFDNRAPEEGRILLNFENETIESHMINGLVDCCVKPDVSGPFRVTATHGQSGITNKSNYCVPSEKMQLYIGDLHCHDFLSEAEGYADTVYQWAIEDRNLDFVSVVPQTHGWIDNEKWTLVKYMNERFHNEGRFVTLLGFEWQHPWYGDKIIHYLGGDQPYLCKFDSRSDTPDKIYNVLRKSDALVICHDTCYPEGSWCSSTDFDVVDTDIERLIELWSMHGSSEGYDPKDKPLPNCDPTRTAMAALRRGLRLGFTAGSDTHSGRPGGSAKEPGSYWGGLTAVWAKNLTRRSIFSALFARRTYALTGARIVLKMTVNGAIMGSVIPRSGNAEVNVDVWAPEKIRKVEILKNTHLLRSIGPLGNECHMELRDKTRESTFYHCRVTQEDGHLAVCSPVWME